MSSPSDLADAAQALAAAVAAVADDPADKVALLLRLAVLQPGEATGADAVGAAMGAIQDAVSALFRRSAIAELGRAAAQCLPRSYDDAVVLRDQVCSAIYAEALRAGDAGDDASCAALRTLAAKVAKDLTARAADLPALRDVVTASPVPALVLAYRLYADIDRDAELAAFAGAADPNFLPTEFRAQGA